MTFLKEVAAVVRDNKNPLVITPNRRTISFLKYELQQSDPNLKVRFMTIQDVFYQLSSLKPASRPELIFRLFLIYQNVFSGIENTITELADFYFWGDMLLADFETIDQYNVPANLVFHDLTNIKASSYADFLSEEQIQLIKQFWVNFEVKKGREQFLYVWKKLPELYKQYVDHLFSAGIAYNGLLYRTVIDNLPEKNIFPEQSVILVGFNALTITEEKLVSHLICHSSAKMLWDIDQYYLNPIHEAGRFFRMYMQHPIIGKTFPTHIPNRIKGKKIKLISCPTLVSQTQALYQYIQENQHNNINTLIGLADETLVTPVLHTVAHKIPNINLTMGMPLNSSLMASFIDLLLENLLSVSERGFYYKPTHKLLQHPYVLASCESEANAIIEQLIQNNWTHIPVDFFNNNTLKTLFDTSNIKKTIIESLNLVKPHQNQQEQVFIEYFIQILNDLQFIFDKIFDPQNKPTPQVATRLFRVILANERIPFEGDPLSGVQVSGILETRNQDFKNIFLLQLNEGVFPPARTGSSFIPHSIRKAHGLPTIESQDAIYAYLFYRLLQRSENITLFYTDSSDKNGELSRYVQQLIYNPDISVETIQYQPAATIPAIKDITVHKQTNILAKMTELVNQRGLSPSAINDYLLCPLKFYFRYVAMIREHDVVEEELDAAIVGDLTHRCMEIIYKPFLYNKKEVQKNDIQNLRKNIPKYIERVFRERFHIPDDQPVDFSGQRKLVREVLDVFVNKTLDLDLEYAPFLIIGLEQKNLKINIPLPDGTSVPVSGIIDRVDLKDNTLRIVDYKTGKDELDFMSIESLFIEASSRNKAAFQTLLYALLYHENNTSDNYKIKPGLINRNNLFSENFKFGLIMNKEPIHDVKPLLNEFKNNLVSVVSDIFNPNTTFQQTTNTQNCIYCPYNQICMR